MNEKKWNTTGRALMGEIEMEGKDYESLVHEKKCHTSDRAFNEFSPVAVLISFAAVMVGLVVGITAGNSKAQTDGFLSCWDIRAERLVSS